MFRLKSFFILAAVCLATVSCSSGWQPLFDGKTLNATWWAVGEEVRVYGVKGEGSSEEETTDPVGTLIAQGSGTTTTLKGSFIADYTPTAGAKLRLLFCSPSYTEQKGTLAYIAANCDHATADVTIREVVAAVLSSNFDFPIPADNCFAGEIGLSGEIRPVAQADRRVSEAARLGFKKIFLSSFTSVERRVKGIEVVKVQDVPALVRSLFQGGK